MGEIPESTTTKTISGIKKIYQGVPTELPLLQAYNFTFIFIISAQLIEE
jgi:hypothetical protein